MEQIMSNRASLVLRLLLLTVLLAPGCKTLGQRAEESALYPALEQSWPGVRRDAERGDAPVELLDGFHQALVSRQGIAVKVRWPTVRSHAQQGIQNRVDELEIGPGVADSLLERVEQFDAGVRRLKSR